MFLIGISIADYVFTGIFCNYPATNACSEIYWEMEMKRIHENVAKQTNNLMDLHRSRVELIRGRLNLLYGTDKLLMTMYLKHGNSFRQIARIRGIGETSIARRIRKITRRLTEGLYIECLRNRNKLTDLQLAIAKDYFLMGLSMKKIAARRRLSYYRVRYTINGIRSIVTSQKRQTG